MAEAAQPAPVFDATPVMLSRLPSISKSQTEDLAQMFFEHFDSPQLAIMPQSTLSLYCFGVTTGVVVDIGHECIDIMPVNEGTTTPGAARRLPLGGKDFAQWLGKCMADRVNAPVQVSEDESRTILQEHVSVASANRSAHSGTKDTIVADVCGKKIELGAECHQCLEPLFENRSWESSGSGVSLQAAVHEAVICHSECYQKKEPTASHDATVKERIFQNVIVCGGCACIPGLRDRLAEELNALGCFGVDIQKRLPPYYLPGCRDDDTDAQSRDNLSLLNAAWLGGNIVASERKMFDSISVSKATYNEVGPNAITVAKMI
jgi:actin-related protein